MTRIAAEDDAAQAETARRDLEAAAGATADASTAAAASWIGPRAASIIILAEICEDERRSRYQIPVAEALRARNLGRVVGAGQMFTDAQTDPLDDPDPDVAEDAPAPADEPSLDRSGLRHALHCVDLELDDVAAAAPVVLDVLRAAGADAFDQGVHLEIHHAGHDSERLPVHKRQ